MCVKHTSEERLRGLLTLANTANIETFAPRLDKIYGVFFDQKR